MQNNLLITLLFFTSFASAHESIIDLPMQFYKGNIQAQNEAAFKALRNAHLCQTDLINKKRTSSIFFRELAYEALLNLGHPHPEIVIITSDPSAQAISIGSGLGLIHGLTAIALNFNEKQPLAKAPYGVIRIIMHHEAWHIIAQHFANPILRDKYYYLNMLHREIEADHQAVHHAQCIACARECAAYFINRHAKENKEPTLKKYVLCSLHNLEQITSDRIEAILPAMETLAITRRKEHPFDIERALRIYIDSRALGDVLCTYHKKMIFPVRPEGSGIAADLKDKSS